VQSVAAPPLHSAQETSQTSHAEVLELAWKLAGHEATQVTPCLSGALAAHVMQSTSVAPEHVAQLEAHAWQRKLLSAYAPSGHKSMHEVPLKTGKAELWSQDVHRVEAPKHVWHAESHVPHDWPSACKNCPAAQMVVHVPAALSRVAPMRQAVQPVLVLLLHSEHEVSHAWQIRLLSAYLPLGQASTQVPAS